MQCACFTFLHIQIIDAHLHENANALVELTCLTTDANARIRGAFYFLKSVLFFRES